MFIPIALYLLPKMKQLMNLGKVGIATILVVFSHSNVDKRLPLLVPPILLGDRFSLHRHISLLDQHLSILVGIWAEATLTGVG